jgi:hypothetical protein
MLREIPGSRPACARVQGQQRSAPAGGAAGLLGAPRGRFMLACVVIAAGWHAARGEAAARPPRSACAACLAGVMSRRGGNARIASAAPWRLAGCSRPPGARLRKRVCCPCARVVGAEAPRAWARRYQRATSRLSGECVCLVLGARGTAACPGLSFESSCAPCRRLRATAAVAGRPPGLLRPRAPLFCAPHLSRCMFAACSRRPRPPWGWGSRASVWCTHQDRPSARARCAAPEGARQGPRCAASMCGLARRARPGRPRPHSLRIARRINHAPCGGLVQAPFQLQLFLGLFCVPWRTNC